MISSHESFAVKAMLGYYNYDYEMFFEYLDEGVIWFGPRENQYLVGKSALAESLESRRKDLKYHIENIETKFISQASNVYTLVMSYHLYSAYPDGRTKHCLERVTITGQKFRDRDGKILWRCPLIQVSNVIPKDSKREFLPLTLSASALNKRGRIIDFPTNNNSRVFIAEQSIKYIVGGKGVFSYVHTNDGVYTVRLLLKDIKEKLCDDFYRCHSSYIVNLKRVVFLSSQKITLDDKTEIPVSSKRYSQIKNDIISHVTNNNN